MSYPSTKVLYYQHGSMSSTESNRTFFHFCKKMSMLYFPILPPPTNTSLCILRPTQPRFPDPTHCIVFLIIKNFEITEFLFDQDGQRDFRANRRGGRNPRRDLVCGAVADGLADAAAAKQHDAQPEHVRAAVSFLNGT